MESNSLKLIIQNLQVNILHHINYRHQQL